jgi:hypothetical protein
VRELRANRDEHPLRQTIIGLSWNFQRLWWIEVQRSIGQEHDLGRIDQEQGFEGSGVIENEGLWFTGGRSQSFTFGRLNGARGEPTERKTQGSSDDSACNECSSAHGDHLATRWSDVE